MIRTPMKRGPKPGNKPPKQTVPVSFRMEPETKALLDTLCLQYNVSQARIIAATLATADTKKLAYALRTTEQG